MIFIIDETRLKSDLNSLAANSDQNGFNADVLIVLYHFDEFSKHFYFSCLPVALETS